MYIPSEPFIFGFNCLALLLFAIASIVAIIELLVDTLWGTRRTVVLTHLAWSFSTTIPAWFLWGTLPLTANAIRERDGGVVFMLWCLGGASAIFIAILIALACKRCEKALART